MRVEEALKIADIIDSPYIRVLVGRDLRGRQYVDIERQTHYAPDERWANVTDKYTLAQNVKIRNKNCDTIATCKEGLLKSK